MTNLLEKLNRRYDSMKQDGGYSMEVFGSLGTPGSLDFQEDPEDRDSLGGAESVMSQIKEAADSIKDEISVLMEAYTRSQQAALSVAYYDKLIRQLNEREGGYAGELKALLDDSYMDMVRKAYDALGMDYDEDEVEFVETTEGGEDGEHEV